MSDQKYDNSNRAAVWSNGKPCLVGYGDFRGKSISAYLVADTRAKAPKPTHHLFATSMDWDAPVHVPLWRDDEGRIGGKHDGYWVNVYVEREKKSPNSPDVSIVFKAMEGAPAGDAGLLGSDDDIPL